jgi:hypothetical protein
MSAALVAVSLAACSSDDGDVQFGASAGSAGAAGKAGGGSSSGAGTGNGGGSGGSAGKGGEGSNPGSAGENPGAGAGGSENTAGSAGGENEAGAGGATAGTGGASAGTGGATAGTGGATAGTGGSTAGTGGATAGTGGASAGTGGASAGTGGAGAGTGGSGGGGVTECGWQEIPAVPELAGGYDVSGSYLKWVAFDGTRAVALVQLKGHTVYDLAIYTPDAGWKLSSTTGPDGDDDWFDGMYAFGIVGDSVKAVASPFGQNDSTIYSRALSGGPWTRFGSLPESGSVAFGATRLAVVGDSQSTTSGGKEICTSVDQSAVYDPSQGTKLFASTTPLGAGFAFQSARVADDLIFFGQGARYSGTECKFGGTNLTNGAFYDLSTGTWGAALPLFGSGLAPGAASVFALDGAVVLRLPKTKDQAEQFVYGEPTSSAFAVREVPSSLAGIYKGFKLGDTSSLGSLGKRLVSVYEDNSGPQRFVWDFSNNTGEPLCPPPVTFNREAKPSGFYPRLWNGRIGSRLAFIREDLSGGIVALP